jgi:hypothetical protein
MAVPESAPEVGAPAKSRLDRVIGAMASSLGNSIGWLAERGVLLLVFAGIWLALAAMLVLNPAAIDELWRAIGTLPILVQLVLWVLFLPVMAAIWVWETSWPDLLRLAIVIGLAAWTLLVFRPTWLHLRTATDVLGKAG